MERWRAVFVIYLFHVFFTSVVKSQSGDGVRRFVFASLTDGEELGSSGITANRPRCTHGDVGPYVPWIKVWMVFFYFYCSIDCIYEKLFVGHSIQYECVCIRGIITKTRVTQTMQLLMKFSQGFVVNTHSHCIESNGGVLVHILPWGIIRNRPCDICSPGGPGEFGGQILNRPMRVVDVSPSAMAYLRNEQNEKHN